MTTNKPKITIIDDGYLIEGYKVPMSDIKSELAAMTPITKALFSEVYSKPIEHVIVERLWRDHLQKEEEFKKEKARREESRKKIRMIHINKGREILSSDDVIILKDGVVVADAPEFSDRDLINITMSTSYVDTYRESGCYYPSVEIVMHDTPGYTVIRRNIRRNCSR